MIGLVSVIVVRRSVMLCMCFCDMCCERRKEVKKMDVVSDEMEIIIVWRGGFRRMKCVVVMRL